MKLSYKIFLQYATIPVWLLPFAAVFFFCEFSLDVAFYCSVLFTFFVFCRKLWLRGCAFMPLNGKNHCNIYIGDGGGLFCKRL